MRRNFNINKVNEQFHELPKYKKSILNKVALSLFEKKSLKQQRQITPEALIMVMEKL